MIVDWVQSIVLPLIAVGYSIKEIVPFLNRQIRSFIWSVSSVGLVPLFAFHNFIRRGERLNKKKNKNVRNIS